MKYLFWLLLILSVTFGQVNDKNFKEKVNGGMVVVIITAESKNKSLMKKSSKV